MTAKASASTTMSLLGCLPFLLGLLILGGMGFCGDGCQADVLSGVKAIREAAR